MGRPGRAEAFVIHHCSGEPMGTADNLDQARELIDARLFIVRQRLVAAA